MTDKLSTHLDQQLAVSEAATAGPWDTEHGWRNRRWPESMTYLRIVTGEPNPISGIRRKVLSTDGAVTGSPVQQQMEADVRFAAAARSGYPAAVIALQRILQLIEDYPVPDKIDDPTGEIGDGIDLFGQAIEEIINQQIIPEQEQQ